MEAIMPMNFVVIDGKIIGKPKWSPIRQRSIFTLARGQERYYVEYNQRVPAEFEQGKPVLIVGKLLSTRIQGEDRAGIEAQLLAPAPPDEPPDVQPRR